MRLIHIWSYLWCCGSFHEAKCSHPTVWFDLESASSLDMTGKPVISFQNADLAAFVNTNLTPSSHHPVSLGPWVVLWGSEQSLSSLYILLCSWHKMNVSWHLYKIINHYLLPNEWHPELASYVIVQLSTDQNLLSTTQTVFVAQLNPDFPWRVLQPLLSSFPLWRTFD